MYVCLEQYISIKKTPLQKLHLQNLVLSCSFKICVHNSAKFIIQAL